MRPLPRLSVATAFVAALGLSACSEQETTDNVIQPAPNTYTADAAEYVLGRVLSDMDDRLKEEVERGSLDQGTANEIKSAAVELATQKPDELVAELWAERPRRSSYTFSYMYDISEQQQLSVFSEHLSPTLHAWLDDYKSEYKQLNGCLLKETPEKLYGIECKDNKVVLLSLFRNKAGIRKIYDFEEQAAFYKDNKAPEYDGFAVLPFSEIRADQLSDIGQQRDEINATIQQNFADQAQYEADYKQLFAEKWPQIQKEFERWEKSGDEIIPPSKLSVPSNS